MNTTADPLYYGKRAMINLSPSITPVRKTRAVFQIAAALAVVLCGTSEAALAANTRQDTFSSAEQAGDALAAAWRANDKAKLLRLFGPGGMKLVTSGDAIAEKEARTRLSSEYEVQHKIESKGERKATLVIGKDEFPYPIPLVKQGRLWHFDTKAGEEEVLSRRIGRNELNAIEVSRAYVEAQREYGAKDRLGNGLHEYAVKVVSDEDKHDGLYWKSNPVDDESPLGPLIANAAAEGYGAPSANGQAPYHGYFYRILTRQGSNAPGGAMDYVVKGHMTRGFALVAFPAKYGDSGVMTFIVNQNGIVFEKNLGPETEKIAREMTEYDPDRSWNTP